MKYVLYVLVGLVVSGGLFFGGLYARYQSQSPEIHAVVENFVGESIHGTSDSIRPFLHPKFYDTMISLLAENGELFKHISRVEEKPKYFSYSWQLGTGETTSYEGSVVFDDGSTQTITIKLVKYVGTWVVYGVHIGDDAPSDN